MSWPPTASTSPWRRRSTEGVLVDGHLISSKYERENGKPKQAKSGNVVASSSVRANSVRRHSRAEAEAPATTAAREPGSGDVSHSKLFEKALGL